MEGQILRTISALLFLIGILTVTQFSVADNLFNHDETINPNNVQSYTDHESAFKAGGYREDSPSIEDLRARPAPQIFEGITKSIQSNSDITNFPTGGRKSFDRQNQADRGDGISASNSNSTSKKVPAGLSGGRGAVEVHNDK